MIESVHSLVAGASARPAAPPGPSVNDPAFLLQAVCDCMAEALLVADASGKVVLIGAAARRLIGLGADEPIPEDWTAVTGRFLGDGVTPVPADRLLVTRALRGESIDGEIFFFRHHGLQDGVWANGSARPIIGSDGCIHGCVVVWRDVSAQIRAEAALRESQAEFRSMFELSAVGSAQADPGTGRLLRVNRKFCEITGYSAEELLARTFIEITHPDDRDENLRGFRAAMAGETDLYGSDKRYVRKDGSSVWVNVQVVPLRDAQGLPIRTVAVIQDITARKRAEESLRQQVELQGWLAKIAATVPGMICSFKLRPDGSACMPYVSSALDELFGLRAEDVREDTSALFSLIHADDIGHVNETIAASASAMTPWRDEFRVQHPVKGEIWVEGHSMPQREPDGSILWHGFVHDISERKRMEQSLRDSERLYRAIGESIDYGVWVCALDGRNLYSSESFLKLVGHSREQSADFGWVDVLHPDDAERTIAAWQECVRTGETLDVEHRIRGVDGRWHDILARGVPVRDERGEAAYWAGINLDISRLKHAEQLLRETEADLNRAQAVARTGSWRLDVRSNELRWSDENHRIFGIPKGVALTYETFLATVHPEDRAFVDRAWRAALRGEPYDIEHRIVVAGRVKWLRERAELEFDVDGMLRGGFGTTQDITERKRSEAALSESETRFRLAMQAVAGVVYDWTLRNDASYWSSGLSRICGVPMEESEPTRRWWRARVHPDDLRRIRPELVRALKARSDQFEVEYRIWHNAGYWVHVSDRACIVRNAAGRPVRLVGSLTDISARKEAEEALRHINETLEQQVAERAAVAEARARALYESERFSRATIDALSSTLCVIDERGRIIAVNKAWQEFAEANGARPDRVGEGADYLAVCDAAGTACTDAAEVADGIRAVLSGRCDAFVHEYQCHSPSEQRWFVVNMTRFPGSGPVRLVVRHENITGRKQAVEEQRESAERLKRLAAHLESVREEQSATIAREVHDELGGTLTMLKLSLATTVDGMAASEPMQARFKGMLDQVDAALQTVKRISANLRPALLDTLGLIATLRWYAGQFSRLTGIATELRLPTYVHLSSERSTAVFRIIQEALTNVAKHSKASRAVITMRKHKGLLIVGVRDNGIGLKASSLSKHDSFGVIGIHERAQYLGGQLSLAGTPKTGTRLTLRIPLDG